ncbi:hypothetical protein PAT3040_02476 [Paenibacillus agaridevorans]|uniref:Aminoglycoside phosphotransferase domain-containing protein n=1 Tax=Paenibacillus agaridevorans TaxID=171404 RepID=A0A2R5EMP4_9BACL|nr:phosphotransferase [Paenibacillus agaridevorans]GBG07912.1 hypothetical protein PAT3040_02476 [Paenibacillus agaridevorans]
MVSDIEQQAANAASRYGWQGPYRIEDAAVSGMNNTTRIISCGMDKYVLRLYNNHGDADTVRQEHDMLKALSNEKLAFRIPSPVYNLDGSTITQLPDGKLACLFNYIEGERPSPEKSTHVEALGSACGELSRILSGIKFRAVSGYSPYYDLAETYASMDKASLLGLADSDAGIAERIPKLEYLQKERERALQACMSVAQLPQQWIHGDICFGNALSIGDAISGLLDFEFVTMDCRAMELAVLLVDLLKPELATGSKERLELAARAFQTAVPLTSVERNLLPTLMRLRLLDVALHFAVRYRDGLDGPEVLADIVDNCAFGCEWLAFNPLDF